MLAIVNLKARESVDILFDNRSFVTGLNRIQQRNTALNLSLDRFVVVFRFLLSQEKTCVVGK
jgi:hypothetical protein